MRFLAVVLCFFILIPQMASAEAAVDSVAITDCTYNEDSDAYELVITYQLSDGGSAEKTYVIPVPTITGGEEYFYLQELNEPDLPEGTETGGVTGTVIWHYTTEAQPDEGAYVALLPLDFEENGEVDFTDFSAQVEYPEGFGGIYTTRADADGKYAFSAVKPGEYMIFMVSYSCLLEEQISDDEFRSKFSFLPEEVPEEFLLTVGDSKFSLVYIRVEEGKITVFDHDFGNTY